MKAVVVYESLWGNTAAIARAIAEGIGPGAQALCTDEATSEVTAGADLIVAGAPVLGFKLPSEKMREGIRANPGNAPAPPDLSHPPLSAWLAALPAGSGRGAAFETCKRGPWGDAKKTIAQGLELAGYRQVMEPAAFIVTGKFGPLRKGEVERARQWGMDLAKAVG